MPVMRVLLGGLVLASLAWLGTGLVYEEGGFGVRLVVKPTPSPAVAFGGGEEGAWARAHPGAPAPWWQEGGHTVLVSGDWEDGVPLWVSAYFVGHLLVLLGWPAALAALAIRALRLKRERAIPVPG